MLFNRIVRAYYPCLRSHGAFLIISNEQILDKMIADGLIEPVEREHVVPLKFPDPDELSPPVLAFQQVGFAYSGKPEDMLYSGVEFGIDLQSRVVCLNLYI